MSTMSDFLQKVIISDKNSVQNVWFCEKMGEWRWSLVWDDGSSSGNMHMHSGAASVEADVYRDLEKTIMWIEAKWPTEEYFQGA